MLKLHITSIPSDPHFSQFCGHPFLEGIRMNGLLFKSCDLNKQVSSIPKNTTVPLWLDIKGRQLRIEEAIYHKTNLELVLNHKISGLTLPHPIIFKAGEDWACVEKIKDGKRLFLRSDGYPRYRVNPGDSIHFRNQNLSIDDNLFTDDEKEKILLSRKMGFDKFYLSYVESNSDICEVRELIGKDCELVLKIESQKGLNFVATKFNKHLHPHTRLMAARGDLYVEVPMPHDILKAQKLVIEKDNQALVGSRMLLSLFNNNVPACSDICELGLLKNIGYRSFLLCDDLCKKGSALERAVETFEALSDLI